MNSQIFLTVTFIAAVRLKSIIPLSSGVGSHCLQYCALLKHTYWRLEEMETHLAKRPSDLKQNGTQERTPISSNVFKTFSHGVIRFVASGSS